MNYYVLKDDDSIALYDTDRERLENTLKFCPNGVGVDAEILSTDRKIIVLDNVPVFADEHEAEIAHQAEQKAEQTNYDNKQEEIKALKDDLLTATLMGDDEWIEELKADYLALTEGAEDE